MTTLIDFFTPNAFSIHQSASDWQHAIDLTTESMIRNQHVEPRYSQAIKDSTNSTGPYYILAPGIAMPHARPEEGVKQTALSMTIIRDGVDFGHDNEPVYLLIGLAAKDADSHIYAIQALSEMLCEETCIDQLINATSVSELQEIVKRY